MSCFKDDSSEETAESTTRKELTPAKRKTQQSPITSYFKERKIVQTPREAKKAKSPNAGKTDNKPVRILKYFFPLTEIVQCDGRFKIQKGSEP